MPLRDYITQDERLRRIGELLLRGVYLWVEASGDSEAAKESLRKAATDTNVVQSRSKAEGIEAMG